MKKTIVLALSALMATSSMGFAYSTNANENAANGQEKAMANCRAVIIKQNANGQTGSETGSENDSKQLPTAVTNCDKFWTNLPD
ncbi:hypothetical protein [Thalassovita mangrovi]|uniref:Secreted protein n=1 Tax=Thalassovita mangrovi TaxID=2692236 RepID=A0A6L8LDR9_9RHOB|nr:hypothetical protein [Thalassovita mangrovi]MYM54088.1 hypothetical protein [Thalassovita mangrovi]